MAGVSLARWRPHVLAAESAGLSVIAYAKIHGLSSTTLYAARQQMRQLKSADFVAVQTPSTPFTQPSSQSHRSPVEIHLSPQVSLRSDHYPDVAWLAALVRTLAATS